MVHGSWAGLRPVSEVPAMGDWPWLLYSTQDGIIIKLRFADNMVLISIKGD